MTSNLSQKFKDKNATIGIIGLGYVGLPLTLTISESGYAKVIGFDIDSRKLELLQANQCYIKHIALERIEKANRLGLLVSSDFSLVSGVDALILCLPTPLTKHREPDLHFIHETLSAITPYIHPDMMISLESTTYPGTTEEVICPIIRSLGLTIGDDFFIVYSPEREDPGNKQFPTRSIPKICGGITASCTQVGEQFYSSIVDTVVTVSSTRAAEMTKLLENIHRSVNIGLVNEMKMVADKMGIDIHEVIEAAATKPFGFTKYTPGPGLGGHCIPIDPYYLTWKAKEYNINTRFIELSGEINRGMPDWVATKVMDALNEKGMAIKGSHIIILGIAYKKNIDDARESPAIRIMEILRKKGAIVAYSDPHIPIFPKMREHAFELTSTQFNEKILSSFDAIVLATDHDSFDYQVLEKYEGVIVDTRNKLASRKNLVRA